MSLTLFLISYLGLLQEIFDCSLPSLLFLGVLKESEGEERSSFHPVPPKDAKSGAPHFGAGCLVPSKTHPEMRQTHLKRISRLTLAEDWQSRFWIPCCPPTPASSY